MQQPQWLNNLSANRTRNTFCLNYILSNYSIPYIRNIYLDICTYVYTRDSNWTGGLAGLRSPHTSANPCANTTALRHCNYTPLLTGISPVVFMQTKSFVIERAFLRPAKNKRGTPLIPTITLMSHFRAPSRPATRRPRARPKVIHVLINRRNVSRHWS